MGKCEHGLSASECFVCVSPKHAEPSRAPPHVSAIHLVALGDKAIVRVEIGSKWYEAIRETMDGPFSHIIEQEGLATLVTAGGGR